MTRNSLNLPNRVLALAFTLLILLAVILIASRVDEALNGCYGTCLPDDHPRSLTGQ